MSEKEVFNSEEENKKDQKEAKKKQKAITGKESVGKSKLIIGLVLIIAAVLIAVFVAPLFATRQTTYQGLAALRDIAAGEQVTEKNYSELFTVVTTTDANIAKNWVVPDATPNFYGKYAQFSIKKGAYIATSDFDYAYSAVKIVVPEDKELVGVRVPSIEADVGYLPKAGDIIRFYGIENDPDSTVVDLQGRLRPGVGKKAIIYELLQYVQIYRAVDTDGLTAGNGRQPVSIVLICSTAQVKQLIEAQNNGLVYFSLISTDSETKAEECLKLQEKIEVEYLSRNADLEDIGYKDVSIDLSKISVNNPDVAAGDYVSFAITKEVETTYVDGNGEQKTKKVTEVFTPDILSCVKVTDVYDEKGISKRLNYSGKAPFDITKAFLGAELTDEQVEALAAYMKEGSVIMQAVVLDSENEDDTYESRLSVVAEAVRKVRIENTRLEQEAAATAEDTTSAEPNA